MWCTCQLSSRHAVLKGTLLLPATQNCHYLHFRHVSLNSLSLQCRQVATCLRVCTGGGSIDTSTVTTTPYVIHYTAEDALGNIAVPVSRSVSVYNPCTPQAYCTASGELLLSAVWTTTHMPYTAWQGSSVYAVSSLCNTCGMMQATWFLFLQCIVRSGGIRWAFQLEKVSGHAMCQQLNPVPVSSSGSVAYCLLSAVSV